MEKRLFNTDDHREIGYSAMIGHCAPDILISDNNGLTGNAKRLALTRKNKEDQADAGTLKHRAKAINATVAATIRNAKGRVVTNPTRSPFGDRSTKPDGSVEPTTMNGDSDKVPTSAIELIENRAGEPAAGRPDNFP